MKTVALGLALSISVTALGGGAPTPAVAEPSAFDGTWDVTLTCPPLNDDVDDAKGYTQRFSGQVGIVKSADYAVNHAARGKSYAFRVRATFEGDHGSGVRLGKRKCEFDFRRR